MKSTFKIILSVASVVAIVALAAPVAKAQCSPAQVFGNTGLGMLGQEQVEVIAGGADNAGNEIGRFWNALNSGFAHNFGGDCPSTNTADEASSWWVLTMAGNRGVSGFIGGGGTVSPCIASSCPGPNDEMMFLVEDYSTGGPPGVGGSAYLIAWRVDATPPDPRYWNLARPTGAASLPYMEFPRAFVTSSNRSGDIVSTTQTLADVGANVYGANAAGEIPDTASIVSFDICTFKGPSEPGRMRSAWDCAQSVPYAGGEVTGVQVDVDCTCPDPCEDDTYVAVGVTFDGGTGADVPSMLVGAATAIECDPNIADPEPERPTSIRPKKTRRISR